ncbi:MAG: hypothetical protein C4558_05620 [Dehalococcoidia bacterium]|nr:MAG: hypothetical protein C4558_05620 [Dehalococcoidia bacterium]
MRSIRPVGLLAGFLFTLFVAVACDASNDNAPTGQTATPAPTVTASVVASVTAETGGGSSAPGSPGGAPGAPPASPTSKPAGPDTSVSSTPGPSVTATAVPISETPVAEAGRTLVLAPIESVQVVSTKSMPPQYSLIVGSGLPSGCAKYAGATVEYRGAQIIVKVYNSMPAAPTPCTAIYGYTTHSVPLGALTPGVAYRIQVNDRALDLVAQ